MVMQLLIRSGPEDNDGVMLPNPQYPLYSATMSLMGGTPVMYNLDEASGWASGWCECSGDVHLCSLLSAHKSKSHSQYATPFLQSASINQ
jgi:aspartate/methionine/tyrosine aminotransferase